ncbi:hypothetical protein AVEN_186614-1, partial [Araneus ventricosus]
VYYFELSVGEEMLGSVVPLYFKLEYMDGGEIKLEPPWTIQRSEFLKDSSVRAP